MWLKRNWNLFVFTPLAFLGGLIFYSITHGPLDRTHRVEDAGAFQGSGLFWAAVVLIGLILYNRAKRKKALAAAADPK